VETFFTVHFAEQWRRGSSKRKRRKERPRLCFCSSISFRPRFCLQKNRKQLGTSSSNLSPNPEREAEEERIQKAKGKERLDKEQRRRGSIGEPAFPHHHLLSSSLKLFFVNLRFKRKIIIDFTNNNLCLNITKRFIFMVYSTSRSSHKNKHSLCWATRHVI